MTTLTERLQSLSSAEDFLSFFGVPNDERVVRVNRLHILKRFHQYLRQDAGLERLDDIDRFRAYRTLLARAYQDFVMSTPARERVFKVFQDTDGTQHVGLAGLRESLADRHRGARPA